MLKRFKFFSLLKSQKLYFYIFFIIILAFYLRTFNINWDNNYYFHPDERAIVMFTIPLRLPESLSEFLDPQSPLNPKFFAYGNFPLYLLASLSYLFSLVDPTFSQYGGIHIIGRVVSAISDVGSLIMVYLIGTFIFNRRIGILSSFIYAIAVFPIQLSHFYAVDTLLNFFMLLCLYLLILLIYSPSKKSGAMLGVVLGFALATKISALFLLIPLFISLLIVLFIKRKKIKEYFLPYFLTIILTPVTFFGTQPYVLLDFNEFLTQTSLQSRMGSDPFIFPYTLQYVGKIPYLHELINIFFYGLGPVVSLVCFSGLTLLLLRCVKTWKKNVLVLFVLSYGVTYFLVFGKFAVGWMRYMLPVYPILALCGGFLMSEAVNYLPKKMVQNNFVKKLLFSFFVLILILYPISFLTIYTKLNTRLQATEWMYKNIPDGSTIAVEHWDDALPIGGNSRYTQLSLPLYEPDTNHKWEYINDLLRQADYIIIASNRLYRPLQKLTDCKNLPVGRCYPRTAQYYKNLFAEKSGFKKVAEFTSYPTIPILNINLIDDNADESFTVYDHPKVMIFKKD